MRVEFESNHPDLSGFSDVTLQDIRIGTATNREQTALRTLVESGWPTDKASVPESVRPNWDVRSELKSKEGLLYKQDRVVIPTALRSSILHKLHVAHRGPDFTLRQARNTVFWPGLSPQVKDMCTDCPTSAQYTQQHPREPLQPYPVPTLPWQNY